MREITTHKVNGCNEAIRLVVLDEPGQGNACHRYRIDGPTNRVEGVGMVPAFQYSINFQNGPIAEVGTNGLTQEVLLAIVIDRLEGFQSGPYECEENQDALDHCRKALERLQTGPRSEWRAVLRGRTRSEGKSTMPKMLGAWEPSAWFCAQSCHVAWAGFAVSLTAAYGIEPWFGVLGVLAFALLKEFWADWTWLEHDTTDGSIQDFTFYVAGALGARLALWWFWPGAVLLALLMLGLTMWDYESQQPMGMP